MNSNDLVRVNKYSNKIRELSILRRITIDYPLFCRDEVAKLLARVADSLPDNLFLQVDSAYRDKSIEQILFDSRNKIMPGLVQNPKDSHSSHYTGGTVDVSLVDNTGAEINLSAPLPKYYQEPQLVSDKISKESQRLRNILNNSMVSVGFAPNSKEYWHYSYGTKSWSLYTKKEPFYDNIDIDKSLFYPIYKRIIIRVLRRLWKLYIRIFKVIVNY